MLVRVLEKLLMLQHLDPTTTLTVKTLTTTTATTTAITTTTAVLAALLPTLPESAKPTRRTRLGRRRPEPCSADPRSVHLLIKCKG